MQASRICLSLLLVTLLAGGVGLAQAQETDARYFPETGHWVSREFLGPYEAAADPALVYGDPISEAFVDARSRLGVQYFQRARFELGPGAVEGQQGRLASPLR